MGGSAGTRRSPCKSRKGSATQRGPQAQDRSCTRVCRLGRPWIWCARIQQRRLPGGEGGAQPC
eukprot:12793-Lingulodinium_polyedra.AAC.1